MKYSYQRVTPVGYSLIILINLLKPTKNYNLAHHWHKLTVASKSPGNAQSLKYITVALSVQLSYMA